MIWHLLGVLISGLACGGIAFMLIKLTRGRLPKWLTPVAAGSGMLGILMVFNYSWYQDKLDLLAYKQIEVDIVETQRNSSFFKPWGYIYPAISQFTFLDGKSQQIEAQGKRLIQFNQYTFYQEYKDRIETRFYLLECSSREMVETNQQGKLLATSQFERLDSQNKIYTRLCKR